MLYVFVVTGEFTLDGYVPYGTDFDGEFIMECAETGGKLKVAGWLVDDVEIQGEVVVSKVK